MRPISKTTFLEYLHCPKNTWFRLHKPELLEKFELSDFERHIIEQGNEVESCARNLFLGGVEVHSTGEEAVHDTVRLMTSKVSTIFQSTFIVDDFIARNDMLEYDHATGRWNIYEVKGTNSLKEGGGSDRDHIEDVAFQVSILKRAHVPLGKYFVIHLNKDYVRSGDLDIYALFKKEDVTEKVHERLPDVEEQMRTAYWYLTQEKEPSGTCECIYQGRKKHCTTFKHSNPHIPDYSVHDISRINEKKLELLIEQNVFDLNDIPEDFKLTDNQKNQVLAHRQQKPIIDRAKIAEELKGLKFPLYFFDYEAFGPAIPIFDGYGPYKHVPFQFSLHILESADAELTHIEYLHSQKTDPSEKVAELLKKHISPKGTVIVWRKTFETMVNRELAMRKPEYAQLMEQINKQIYDIEEIFTGQHYIHHGFKGRTSLKMVLPVLAPHLKYSELNIREGGQAADAWWTMVSPTTSPKESKQIATDLKVYCGLDTYAMYAIWKHLIELIN